MLTQLIDPRNFDTIEQYSRFQRIIKFQKLINNADAATIRAEFVLLSAMSCDIDRDEAYSYYDYDNMHIFDDGMFGYRETDFNTGMNLVETRIIIPCNHNTKHRGVNCRIIDHLMGIGDCIDCVNLYGIGSWYPTE